MDPRNFFTELKRRNVIRMAGLYLVGAWLLVQVASTVLPMFGAPDWLPRSIVILLAIGFVPIVLFSWVFELTPQGIQRDEDVAPERSIGRHTARRMDRITIAILLLALGYFVFDKFARSSPRAAAGRSASSATVAKSIAVLPFENLSDDKANSFFASGIQDEILTALAKVSGLKVVSRTSTARYQSSPGNLGDIAKQLGVAHILEGSVQKAGDKVHINVQLIRADTDAHLWAQSYDRSLSDIFAVEAEVAGSVADALRATLSPEEKARVEDAPTKNSDSYVLYLRALEYERRPSDLLDDEQKAVELYTKAISLDPSFALARARLSRTLSHIYLDYQATEAIATRARFEADESLRLQPDLGEAHFALAMYLYWTRRDYQGATRELEIAGKLMPNNAEVESSIAYIWRRQGRWRDARERLERSLQRDPHNAPIAHEYYLTLFYLRDWGAAAAAAPRAVAAAPDSPTIVVDAAYVDVVAKGNLNALRTAVGASSRGGDADNRVTLARLDVALLARDRVGAERALAELRNLNETDRPKSYYVGVVAKAFGDSEEAKRMLESSVPKMESQSAEVPNGPFGHAQLAILYAYLGRKEDALREAQQALDGVPESRDGLDAAHVNAMVSVVYAHTGEVDRAITLVERLLTTPGACDPGVETSITLFDLKLRWEWDVIRHDPRFQKILAAPEPKTIYQ